MHEIDTMFSVRQRPWHAHLTGDKTAIVPEYPANWGEARKLAGLTWEPEKRPLYDAPLWVPAAEVPEGAIVVGKTHDECHVVPQVPEVCSVVRSDTGARLATVPASFPLITHDQMGELCESFTEAWTKAGAQVFFETAGSLLGGAVVWALIRLDEPFQVAKDDSATYPYAALMNSHNAKGACKFTFTQVRIVCWNTFQMADLAGEADGFEVKIRHTGDTSVKIEEAKKALAQMRENAQAYKAMCNDLADLNVSDEAVKLFLEDFIPMPDGAGERTRNSRNTARAVFMNMYQGSLTSVPGNAYGLFQAVGEYLDHARRVQSPDTYLSRTVLKAEPAKTAALAKIRELVAVAA